MPRQDVSKVMKTGDVPRNEKERDCITNVYCGEEEKKTCICIPTKDVCTFEVYMRRVSAKNSKDDKAELMYTAYANGKSAVWPSGALWTPIHPLWEWRSSNLLVTRLDVEKGTTRAVAVWIDAIEAGTMLEGNWEFGTSDIATLSLTPGVQTAAVTVMAPCKKVKNTQASVVTCDAYAEFVAFQVTP